MNTKSAVNVLVALVIFIIGTAVFIGWRLRSVEAGTLAPSVSLKESMDNYQSRIGATERILREGRL